MLFTKIKINWYVSKQIGGKREWQLIEDINYVYEHDNIQR